jgi:branched-chain amino acid transport system substrate-binding protein
LKDISGGGTKCYGWVECSDLLAAGEDIDFDGVSGPIEFDDNGEITMGTMGVYVYEANDKIAPLVDNFIVGAVPAPIE